MVQMDEITQQNASLVEEVASASSAMKEQAMSLKEQVAFFNVGEAEISLHVAKNKNVTNPEINQTKITHYNDEDWKDF